jgi:uncharacterized protein
LAEIEIHEFKRMNLEGATVVDGFPSVGLVSSIVATSLISTLNLDQIAALDSKEFPPLSMVYETRPKFPARIYASEQLKLAVFLSEFTPEPHLDRSLATTILSWARENYCSLIVSPVGVPNGEDSKNLLGQEPLGVGSTDRARLRLSKAGIEPLRVGIIGGISGILLNEGRWSNFDVISLAVGAHKQFPDARAAAKIVQSLNKLQPEFKMDVKPLLDQAEEIENRLKVLRKQAAPVEIPNSRSKMEIYR